MGAAAPAIADGDVGWPELGRTVASAIDELRDSGIEIAYSSRLVPPDMMVTFESTAPDRLGALLQVLEPHGLTLVSESGVILVVRSPRSPSPSDGGDAEPAGVEPVLENITVSASRYEISRDIGASRFVLDQRSIESMPDVGDDPIRITQRLPGSAASGASARTHFRGGEQGEVGIVLNGQRLFDPFHVRDYQNIFSTIDSRAIEGVEVYTGGFPVRFGDRMSGVVLMESIEAERPRHTEIGLSVFNTSLLHASNRGDVRWLFSGRRGNLDLVLDDKLGRPAYYDLFSQFEIDLGPRTTLAANALYAADTVTVILESDPTELEEASSDTRSAQAWFQLDTTWSDTLSSRTALSFTDYRNVRRGISNDAEKLIANVSDVRDVTEIGFRQDWSWRASGTHVVQWGFHVANSEAAYDYDATADYFGLQALFAGQSPSVARSLTAQPDGGSYGAYLADRWKLSAETVVEWGLRWDDQTYTGIASDSQLSPRLSVLRRLGDDTELRLSWGRYHQSQGVHELQIEDGIVDFWRAQRADHLIAGLTHRLGDGTSLRLEAFHKDIRHVRPRFENLFDPLALIPELSADRVRLDPSRARSMGLEISMEGTRGSWDWWGSYTLSEAVDRIGGRDEARSWDQRHAVQAGAAWTNDRWTFAAAAGVRSGWPTTDLVLTQVGLDPITGEPQYTATPGPRNDMAHPIFASLDMRLSRSSEFRYGTFTWFVEISNVTDRRNVCCVDWDVADGPGGTLELENSNDYWLPLLPAVGFLWEF